MILPKIHKLIPVIFLVMVGTAVKGGTSQNAQPSDSSEECHVFGNCGDPEEVLKGIINLPENYNSLFKAFHHTNHRNPTYVIITYALNTTSVECSNMYGSGEIPGNHGNSSLQSWIWTTSPVHAVVNPFALVEFGLLTPWISYSLVKTKQAYSLLALHTSACIAVPYHFSSCDGASRSRSGDDCAAYILASVTTVLKGVIDNQDWTYAQLGEDAQYALLIDSGNFGGMVSMYVSMDERYKVHILQGMFYLLHLSLAVGISMAMAKWVTQYANFIVHNSVIPDVYALIWATVHVFSWFNLLLSLKLLLVGIVYLKNSAKWIGILALLALFMYTIVALLITIRATSLYDKLCVPKSWQLVILIFSLGILRSKRAVQAVSIFTVSYFAPLMVLHLVFLVCSILQDPLQHSTAAMAILLLVCTAVSLMAAFYSLEYIFSDVHTENYTCNYKEQFTLRAISSMKRCAKFFYFTMVFTFAMFFLASLYAFGLLAKLRDFYLHYQVSNGVTFIVLPPLFSLITWAIRYGIINFKTFVLPRDIPFH